MCYELIQGMSKDAVEMLKTIDRFSAVYQKQTTNSWKM